VTGVVHSYVEDEIRKFGFIRADDGEMYFVGRANIAPDEKANVFLMKGEPVTFRAGKHSAGAKYPEAFDVVPARIDEDQSAPEDWREELVIKSWQPKIMQGMAARPDGKGQWFHVNYREVLTLGFIQKNTRIWTGIRRSDRNRRQFECHSVEVIMEEK
jgi:hypothetical protein